MTEVLWPIAFAVFSWWIGTGLVFIAERMVRDRTQAALSAIAAAGMLSLFGIAQSSGTVQPAAAYLGFASSMDCGARWS